MTDGRIPRRAQVVLLDDRLVNFLIQVRQLSKLMCNRFESNVKVMLFVLLLSAATSLAGTFRHGSITFQLAREGIFWIVSYR